MLMLDGNNDSAHQYIETICLAKHADILAIPHLRLIAALRPQNPVVIRQLSYTLLSNDEAEDGPALLLQAYAMNLSDLKWSTGSLMNALTSKCTLLPIRS